MAKTQGSNSLALILAGPILRKVTTKEVVLWFATSKPCQFTPRFAIDEQFNQPFDYQLDCQLVQLSSQCFVYLLRCHFDTLPADQVIYYDVALTFQNGRDVAALGELLPNLYYPGHAALSFFIPSVISSLFFGSCRNIHHSSDDALVYADNYLADHLQDLDKRPCIMLHGGDQVYVDDIAGPTLQGIHRFIDLLGLTKENLPDDKMSTCAQVHHNHDIFYCRQDILPKVTFKSERLYRRFLPFRRTMPVFSSVKAHNHLITLAEMFVLYLLTWSPQGWDAVGDVIKQMPQGLTQPQQDIFKQELKAVKGFIDGLEQARRVMAHVPNYMIFDDHDVTDDWNLTAQWEDNVYSNPFSKRIISNAMVAYWLFQGWGNAPEKFDHSWREMVQKVCDSDDEQAAIELEKQVFDFNHWHYSVDLDPNVIVLDTRTHRWRSERSLKNPSGLMDWERLVELEEILENKEAGIILSAAPIFGVKLIETIQRVFTFFGCELMVDAENWMAHKGSARKLLQIFARVDTPDEIVVLSGDVHYSFCFKVAQRFGDNDTQIWQLTSSGMKNEFPPKWLNVFDKLERLLYFAASPINIFTKRRALQIEQLSVKQANKQILTAKSNIGVVEFENNRLKRFKILVDIDKNKEFL